ncbi:hypothetical protein EST38_g5400 [Candolleomyces aberdarensis]|uniref:Uncharacterized protein n=1 Tax=Candolleomyces aberdarensis TaxID=2316362 RepID=A0A4Q2DM88_9AGAR|nr:hypothetical protein EST38_g5400 [Candolleomyces aberdarensis]
MSSDDTSSNSPVRDMLGTNLIPSNIQVNQIRAFLEAPLNELGALNREVAIAQRVLDALLAKQRKLSGQIEAHQALIHPMRRLPKELLQEVFLHCLPSEHLPVMSASEAPILLTRICRPWRNLALSTPALWSSIHIPIPRGKNEDEHHEATDARLECLKWWLKLTKDTRLTISLYWPNTLRYAFGTEHIFPQAVIDYSTQIRTLELDLPDDVYSMFAKLSDSELPNLESVVLHLPVPPGHPTRGTRALSARLWRAPKLKRVVWESVDDDFLRLPLQWQQMEEIDIGASSMVPLSFFSSTDACGLVEACPNLTRLRINLTVYPHSRLPPGFGGQAPVETLSPSSTDSDGTTNSVPQRSPIVLQYLTTLDLTDIYLDHASPIFLEHLQLPALTTLSYKLVPLPIPLPDQHPLIRFLRAQVHHPIGITKWKIETTSMTGVVFIECLKLMPLLKHLHVEDSRSLGHNPESMWGIDISPSDYHLQELLPISVRRREEWGYHDMGKFNEIDSDEEEGDDKDVGIVNLDEMAMEVEEPAGGGSSAEVPLVEPPVEQEEATTGLELETLTPSPPDAEVGTGKRTPLSRISVAIPVDTSDLAAEESECLCPHLETLRVDRASFTSKGLRTFVKARLELAGVIQRQQNLHDSSGPSSPSFVSAPSSPILPTLPSSPITHHKPFGSGAGAGGIVALQSIQVGLVYPRPPSPPRDDTGNRDGDAEGEEDLESELRTMGVNAKLLYRQSTATPVRRRGVRNDARDGVRRVVGWR